MRAIPTMDLRELLEERRSLDMMTMRMDIAMIKAANWLISQFAPRGPIMSVRDLSYCHKAVWGLFEFGHLKEVERLLNWIEANARQAPARCYFPEEPPFNKDLQLLYRFLTFARVAEAIRHPAFANDAVRQEVLTYQHASGGVFGNKEAPQYNRTLNGLLAAFFGEWALAAGLVEPAERAGEFLVCMNKMNRRAMNATPGRYYFNYDPQRGALVTEAAPGETINCFVDTAGDKQHFFFIGAAMALLADLYEAAGKQRYLEAAEELAAFEQRLNPVGLRWPSYCKIGWGAAELYAVTGKPEHRRMAANVSEITFMSAQTSAGGWEHMLYPLRDEGVWRQVNYDGQGRVPQSVPDDGSWARLSGQEIAGEFMAEMGRTLKVFKAAQGVIERRLEVLA